MQPGSSAISNVVWALPSDGTTKARARMKMLVKTLNIQVL
jgi:hypothetical protein